MDYWCAHPGVALSILEKLLNYSILTPFSVVDWTLVASTPANGTNFGLSLAQSHTFELVSNTVAKVTSRVRQLSATADGSSDKETQAMRDLFAAMNDALTSWASGSKDEMIEEGDGTSEQETMLRRWGQRWLRVFQRKAAIEEAFLLEAGRERMNVVADGANDS